MADKKISELTQILGSAVDDANDELAIVDTSETTTKAITRAELLSGISNLSLGAISETITATAVDVFVYDTSQDSDGGAWRKRMQNKSWYNETLNTATRGSRREFPSVALIVATASTITIYDADDPSLPMWMVFNSNARYLPGSFAVSSVFAVNGEVACGGNSTFDGLNVIRFPSDSGQNYRGPNKDIVINGGISGRNDSVSVVTKSSGSIINEIVNDVAMTVLSGAPIDAATGLAVPTIAVATDGGTSVINNDGTVADSTQTVGILKVWFNEDGRLFYSDEGSDQVYYTDTFASDGFNAGGTHYDADAAPYTLTTNVVDIAGNAFAHTSGVTLLDEAATKTEGMVAYITDEYNTGWMHGDIKGAFLSSTDTASLVGTSLDEGFTSYANQAAVETAGYVFQSPNVTFNAAADAVDYSGDAGFDFDGACSGLVGGNSYTIEWTQSGRTTGSIFLQHPAGNNIISNSADGTYSATLVYDGSGIFRFAGGGSYDGQIDNVSVKRADEDRSVNANPLTVNGTITRTAVATGAELVGYSGFSASNYLEQPYNADLDFGTGDFYACGWGFVASSGGGALIARYAPDNSGGDFDLRMTSSGFASLNIGGSAKVTGTVDLRNSTWVFYFIKREGGTVYLYVNGILVGSAADTTDLTNASAKLSIGLRSLTVPDLNWDGSIALVRIGAGAPAAAQIKKSYEDEKYLFQENADAVLTNSTVAALAFDPDTNLLHVGGDVGRDEFQGLRRTATTAGAVTSAISAQDDLVATGKATTVDVVKPEINLREILTKLSS